MHKLFDIEGKNAVVVGGAGGIGQALAQGLAEAGVNVIISSRKEASLERAKEEIKAACGKDVDYVAADATDEASVQNLVAKSIEKLGKVDILVCAQGLNKKFPAEEFPMDTYLDILKCNVYGIMLCAKSFAKHMFDNGYGKIVILSSVRSIVATKGPGNAGYAASKGAVNMLIRQLASEFGPHGITVNGIGPTVTETPMMKNVIEQRGGDAYRKALADDLPMRRMAVPEDCVGSCLFLASPASDFMTGNILYPDGGLTAVR